MDKIIAMDVINVAVVIVINAVARNFAGVRPHVIDQIRMGVIDSRIDHADNHLLTTRLNIPGFNSIDVRIDGATSLSGVIESP